MTETETDKPVGTVRSKAAVARTLEVQRNLITAWVVSESIPTFAMESTGGGHGIDEIGYATLEKLAAKYKQASNH